MLHYQLPPRVTPTVVTLLPLATPVVLTYYPDLRKCYSYRLIFASLRPETSSVVTGIYSSYWTGLLSIAAIFWRMILCAIPLSVEVCKDVFSIPSRSRPAIFITNFVSVATHFYSHAFQATFGNKFSFPSTKFPHLIIRNSNDRPNGTRNAQITRTVHV